MDSKELILLGQIDGKLDGIKEQIADQNERLADQNERLDKIDDRLRVVEQKAAVTGAISGGAISIGMALIIEGVRQAMKLKGG